MNDCCQNDSRSSQSRLQRFLTFQHTKNVALVYRKCKNPQEQDCSTTFFCCCTEKKFKLLPINLGGSMLHSRFIIYVALSTIYPQQNNRLLGVFLHFFPGQVSSKKYISGEIILHPYLAHP